MDIWAPLEQEANYSTAIKESAEVVKVSLGTLPFEIKLMIANHFDSEEVEYTLLCLGLTCRSFYAVLKHLRPECIDLFAWWINPIQAQSVVENLLGVEYRATAYFTSLYSWYNRNSPLWVRRSVYGDGCSLKEHERLQIYADWKAIRVPRNDFVQTESVSLFNHPFGLGEDWYKGAYKKVWSMVCTGFKSKDAVCFR